MIEPRYQYIYAIIDPSNDMCIEVRDTTRETVHPDYIPISKPDGNYLFKYYDRATGKWYIDKDHTTEWIPE